MIGMREENVSHLASPRMWKQIPHPQKARVRDDNVAQERGYRGSAALQWCYHGNSAPEGDYCWMELTCFGAFRAKRLTGDQRSAGDNFFHFFADPQFPRERIFIGADAPAQRSAQNAADAG